MLNELFENISYKIWDIKCNIKSIINSINNIFYYLPVIWKDRYWDYEFILILLKHKLQRDKEYFFKNDIVEDTYLIHNQINEVIKYIDNYINVEKVFINERPDLVDKFTDFNVLSSELKEYQAEWCREEDEFKQKNWEKIWECISKNGQKWWD